LPEILTIENLGPIRRLEIELRRLTVLIGEQASGKSLVAHLFYFFQGLPKHLARIYTPDLVERDGWQAEALTRILDDLMGVPFRIFANGIATLRWRMTDEQGREMFAFSVDIDNNGNTVRPSENLAQMMAMLAKDWSEAPDILGQMRELEQFFIPTDRGMFSRFSEWEPSVLYSSYLPEPLRRFADTLQSAVKLYSAVKSLGLETSDGDKSDPPSGKDFRFLQSCQKKALAGEPFIPADGPLKWQWQVESPDGPKTLPIEATSSGQMQAWPFFAIACTYGLAGDLTFYFEEPESHLHPRAQAEITKAIVYLVNKGSAFLITTHSPFIAYSINNMIQRFLSHKGEVPEGQLGLDPDDVAAYNLFASPDRAPEDIMDRDDTNLLKLDGLDDVANELGAEFDELLEMED